MSNSRKTTYSALLKVEIDDAYSNITLNNILNNSDLNKRDRSFVCALFYGVLENKITLDYIISLKTKMPLKKIDTKVLVILRMGVYQLLYMDNVPESAAVNESVMLAKQIKLSSASGFINGVLRSLARENIDLEFKELKTDKYLYLSVKYSCPMSLIKHFCKNYGEATAISFFEQLKGRPQMIIRVNSIKTTAKELLESLKLIGVKALQIDEIDNAIAISNTGSIEELPQFTQGLFHVQDIASQICCSVLNPKKGQTIIDVCAAPGGKSFTIAEYMQNNGKIYCYDLYENKLKLINDTAKRLGINIIETAVRNAEIDELNLCADAVLCDVPCSGLGILGRKPEIRYKKDLGISTLPPIQYNILCNSAKAVKKGGLLIYSTCTLNPKENGDNANKFLQENNDFEPISINVPNNFIRTISEPNNQFTFFPQTNGTDGFFISAFKRIR